MKRRLFLKRMTALPALVGAQGLAAALPSAAEQEAAAGGAVPGEGHGPGRIANEYALFLPGERKALEDVPKLLAIESGRARVQHNGRTATLGVCVTTGARGRASRIASC
ncbi:MAG TPA: hypothetical protein VMW54_06130 [Terriglobia bacterium]|nr:hypothetical protein [Terriglobia bacterium]